MDFGISPDDADRYMRSVNPNIDTPTPIKNPATFSEMLDRIEHRIDSDPLLRSIFLARFGHMIQNETVKVSLEPFPAEVGTLELSIWDNQPKGKRTKIEGDKSRDKPARYAIDIRACSKGHTTPLTTKSPTFRANVGDLFTPDQIKARLKRAWKGIDPQEAEFLLNTVLPQAEGNLVARLCLKRSKACGGGTHWHPFHYALVSEQELIDREISRIMLITGEDSAVMLPRCSTLDATGKAFPLKVKTTASGERESIVVAQCRVTDLETPKMRSWATGAIHTA
jgi:hypothetical protein